MISLANCFVRLFPSLAGKLRSTEDDQYNTTDSAGGTAPSPQQSKPHDRKHATTSNQSPTRHTPTQSPSIAINVRKPTIPETFSSRQGNATALNLSTGALTPSSTTKQPSETSSLTHDQNASRSRASSDGSGTNESLKEQLRYGRRECPGRAHFFFVPKSTLEGLITVPVVARDIQITNKAIEEKEASRAAEDACQRAKKLYAALAYVKKGSDVCSLLKEGVTDQDLPLTRKEDNHQGSFALSRNSKSLARDPGLKESISTFEGWSDKEREKFDRVQWWMTAPFFVPALEDEGHHELDDKTILPFVPFEGSEEMKKPIQGGYSEVYRVRLHPAHHSFWVTGPEEKEPLIAIKKLISLDKNEFDKEVTILKALGAKKNGHPHLIKLLATYRYKGKYHLMFPCANANLRVYWQDRKMPTFDAQTVLWSMRQMTGIAEGLLRIHKFEVTIPLKVSGAGEMRVQKDAELSVSRGEELFGRHGDIKPENILWFEKTQDCTDEKGVLQIADFGLGRFHGRDSRSNVNPDTIVGSPTYEPPECKLRRSVSRSYDLWSLGCLYLEFITWLLKGTEAIDGFSEFRGRQSSTGINDDNFFTIYRDPITGPEGKVRDKVVEWVDQLHQHEKCSHLIHDLLDLIMEDLLLIDSKERCQTSFLYMQMKLFLGQAEKDQSYLLKPVPPGQKRNSRSQSASNVLNVDKLIPRRIPSAGQEHIPSPEREELRPLPVIPKIALRPARNQGMKKGKSVTWPTEASTG